MKNFEKEAKEQLDKYRSATELNPLWEKINLELRPKRRYGALLWWPLLFGSAALILAVLYKQHNQAKQDDGVIHATNIISNESLNSKPSNLTNHEVHPNAYDGKSRVKPIENSDQKSTGLLKSKNNAFGQSKVNSTTSGRVEHQLGSTIVGKTESFKKEEKKMVSSIPPAELELAKVEKPAEDLSLNILNDKDSKIESFTSLEFILFPVKANNKNDEISALPANKRAYNSKDKFSLYLGIYGGYGIPYKSLIAKDNNNKQFESTRSATETILEEYQFGAYLGSKYNNGLFVEAGFEYNRINERFDYLKTITDTIGMYLISGFIINNPGDTSYLKDTLDVTRISNYYKKIYNQYSFYSIPISVGYEFNKMARTRFYIKGGVMVNLAIKNEVEILDKEGVPTRYQSKETSSDYPFKPKIGLIPFLSIGARYNLNTSIELFGELNYKHIYDITADDYSIKQHYDLISANVGLQFHF
ncbi:MAG TPA: hypothetical protein VK590_07390 [Saprospiraceae bacterium]|nr:hypothetical protein [Saprospiraceae bacterium]